MSVPAALIDVPPCRRCGETHGALPADIALDVPDRVLGMGPEERDARLMIGDDSAALDSRSFFLRATIALPIVGTDQDFRWHVWFSVEGPAFKRARALWRSDRRRREPAIPGRLANTLPGYPPASLGAELGPAAVGERFRASLARARHPLSVHARDGVPPAFLQALAESLVHDA